VINSHSTIAQQDWGSICLTGHKQFQVQDAAPLMPFGKRKPTSIV
jgi:hypothetical protein